MEKTTWNCLYLRLDHDFKEQTIDSALNNLITLVNVSRKGRLYLLDFKDLLQFLNKYLRRKYAIYHQSLKQMPLVLIVNLQFV